MLYLDDKPDFKKHADFNFSIYYWFSDIVFFSGFFNVDKAWKMACLFYSRKL